MNMNAYYDFKKLESPVNPGEEFFYPYIVTRERIGTDDMIASVRNTTYNAAEIRGALELLVDRIRCNLAAGNLVEIEGLGTFSLSLKCTQEVTDPSKIRAESIRIKGVNFRPSKEMLIETQGMFHPLRSPEKTKPSARLGDDEVKALLERHFARTPRISTYTFAYLASFQLRKAQKTLRRLESEGYLERYWIGRNLVYSKKEVKEE